MNIFFLLASVRFNAYVSLPVPIVHIFQINKKKTINKIMQKYGVENVTVPVPKRFLHCISAHINTRTSPYYDTTGFYLHFVCVLLRNAKRFTAK